MLTDIPDGVACYLDATIFYYHLVEAPALSDDCSDLLKRIELGRVHGVTSSVAIAEATHKVMLADVVQRHGVDHKGLIARLKRHPELLDGLTNHHRVAATVRSLRFPVEAITLDLLARTVFPMLSESISLVFSPANSYHIPHQFAQIERQERPGTVQFWAFLTGRPPVRHALLRGISGTGEKYALFLLL